MAKTRGKWVATLVIIGILFVLATVFSSAIALLSGGGLSSGNVALIHISGPIVVNDGLFFEGSTSTKIVSQIDEASQRDDIKAFIFDINSPGGSGVASYEIAQRIKQLDVTTVAVIRDLGASGAYWVASAADVVIANPLSITGSIGVYGSYLDLSGLIDRYNVSYERLVAGEFKDAGTPWRELSDVERTMFQEKLDLMHHEFIRQVSVNRDLSVDEVKALADGFFLLGSEALDRGLVDRLGTPSDAIEFLEQELDDEVVLAEFSESRSIIDLLSAVSSRPSDWSLSGSRSPETQFFR